MTHHSLCGTQDNEKCTCQKLKLDKLANATLTCQRCASEDSWDDVSDAQTGTMYVRCRRCGTHKLASPRGWVDWHVGLMLDSQAVTGSAWTQKVSPELVPELSKLSKPR